MMILDASGVPVAQLERLGGLYFDLRHINGHFAEAYREYLCELGERLQEEAAEARVRALRESVERKP